MQIHTVSIELTQEEVETIGDALCATIKERLVDFADKDVDIDDYIQEERALLYDLTNAGYQLWVNAGDSILNGYHTIDVDKWIDVEKARVLAVTKTTKKKK